MRRTRLNSGKFHYGQLKLINHSVPIPTVPVPVFSPHPVIRGTLIKSVPRPSIDGSLCDRAFTSDTTPSTSSEWINRSRNIENQFGRESTTPQRPVRQMFATLPKPSRERRPLDERQPQSKWKSVCQTRPNGFM